MPLVSIFYQHSSKVISQMMKKSSFFLPVHLAGLGTRDPTKTATTANCSSKLGTQVVHESVKGVTESSVPEHLSKLKQTVSQTRHTQSDADLAKLNTSHL